MSSDSLIPIPQVPKHLFGLLGNLPDIDPGFQVKSMWQLADLYGPIYELDMISRKTVVISSYRLAKDVLEDEHYEKLVTGFLEEHRNMLKDGLFTAYPEEMNWHKAHRILMPVFGPMAVRKMFDGMLDMAGQMILRWDRLGPDHEIITSDDFTRLAFDTIGFCAFNYRFNSFYSNEIHPFAVQMGDSLLENGKRANRTRLETSLRYWSQKKLQEDVAAMHKLCDDIVADRIKNPKPDVNDLLNVMLHQKDPVTGEGLSEENVRYQMATFLVAGHETTSGTLSFLFHRLLTNPETYHKAQKEVDEVLGDDPLTLSHLPKLKYIDACVRETLRIGGPINLISRHSKKPEVIDGKYAVTPEVNLLVSVNGLHHDPAIWGEDHDLFKPERMMDMTKYPTNAFRPFGTGMRACIGRAFAEQEILMNVALILQRFQVEMADPQYHLELKSTGTVKPLNFGVKVRRRPGKQLTVGLQQQSKAEQHRQSPRQSTQEHTDSGTKQRFTILYGSNAGTCKAYAEDLASRGAQYGSAATVKALDSAVEDVPMKEPVVIIAPSYEGKPADNARKFCSWLEANSNSSDKLSGAKYLLFGVGNSEWATTYHKVPKMIDECMKKMGASQIAPPGFIDVKIDTIGPWDEWCEKHMSDLTGQVAASSQALQVKIERSNASAILGGFKDSVVMVKENVQIAGTKIGPSKMHMEVELPKDMTYQSGDYLVVLPANQSEVCLRVVRRFKLRSEDTIQVTNTRKEFLKTAAPLSIWDLLSTRVELGNPITKRQLQQLIACTSDTSEKAHLEQLSQSFDQEVLHKRMSVLDVLEDHQSCSLQFADYLDMLQQLTPRQYSVSSSSLAPENFNAGRLVASISYDVLDQPSLSGHNRQFQGVCSKFLSQQKPGDSFSATIRPTNAAFHLPQNIETPIIMIAAGTGLAPMRGFLQERAAILAARGGRLGPALLFFGCRDVDEDYIYHHELEHWEKQGVVSLRPTFSKRGPQHDKFKYAHERIYAEKDEVAKLFTQGGKIFLCGSASKLARSTADTCKKIWREAHPDKSEQDAEAWLDEVKNDRYVSDVFG